MGTHIPAEIFPPGEFLKEELEARNWSQVEFAEIIGKDTRLVYEVIGGRRMITPETAVIFSEAFGTSPELWMNLESQYQLSKVRGVARSVSRRADLHTNFPLRDMIKRRWIVASENLEVVEQQLLRFFEIKAVNDVPQFSHAAKKSNHGEASIQQLAWLFRVREMAGTMVAPTFDKEKLKADIQKLSALTSAPEETRHAAKVLLDCGVRVIFVEPLPGSKIDGACFWLNDSPVIGMSLRFDRIDNFWFVLRHEIEHVLQGHGKNEFYFDQDLDGTEQNIPEEEMLANIAGADFCVSTVEMQEFIDRVAPYFSEQKVLAFAQRIGVHPGLVVGQLHRILNRHDIFKKHQAKVRNFVISSTATDGWGQEYPID